MHLLLEVGEAFRLELPDFPLRWDPSGFERKHLSILYYWQAPEAMPPSRLG